MYKVSMTSGTVPTVQGTPSDKRRAEETRGETEPVRPTGAR